jgi:GNAT superfamily N-acetyltransferase
VLVRPVADGDDLAAIGRLIQDAYFSLPGYPHDDEYDQEIADVARRRHDTTVVVAEEDGQVLGTLTYVDGPIGPYAEHGDGDAASFRYVAVSPAAQGRGAGRALVRWAVEQARGAGKARVRIHTLESMERAMRLYEREGFVRDPDHDQWWDGIRGVAYRLDL